MTMLRPATVPQAAQVQRSPSKPEKSKQHRNDKRKQQADAKAEVLEEALKEIKEIRGLAVAAATGADPLARPVQTPLERAIEQLNGFVAASACTRDVYFAAVNMFVSDERKVIAFNTIPEPCRLDWVVMQLRLADMPEKE
eukprot:Opistho-1_new@3200